MNDEFQSKLAKKEREVEVRTQEKEELLETVNKMKTKLEKEAASHYDAKQHIAELNRHIEELKVQVGRSKEKLQCVSNYFEHACEDTVRLIFCKKNY